MRTARVNVLKIKRYVRNVIKNLKGGKIKNSNSKIHSIKIKIFSNLGNSRIYPASNGKIKTNKTEIKYLDRIVPRYFDFSTV